MTQKIFITKSGKANISCPECGKTQQMDVSQFGKVEKKVKLKCKCSCKNVFPVVLERRMQSRKPVDFPGNLLIGSKNYPINIVDISKNGLKIRTKGILDLQIEDKVTIEFVLDDPDESKISKQVIVRKINEIKIGVEFVSKDHYDKFGPYLLFHLN